MHCERQELHRSAYALMDPRTRQRYEVDCGYDTQRRVSIVRPVALTVALRIPAQGQELHRTRLIDNTCLHKPYDGYHREEVMLAEIGFLLK